MASHYIFETEFCNPAAGWEKRQVEKNVRDARHRLWQPVPHADSLKALNTWLEQRCQELWRDIARGLKSANLTHGAQPGAQSGAVKNAKRRHHFAVARYHVRGIFVALQGFSRTNEFAPKSFGMPILALKLPTPASYVSGNFLWEWWRNGWVPRQEGASI